MGIKLCPICEEGHLKEVIDYNDIDYNGSSGRVTLKYACCDECGSDVTLSEHSRDNKRAIKAFKKNVDGLLTGAEIRAIRNDLGITQQQAADIFGGGKVAFSKYESDDVSQSEAMDKLLRVARAVPSAFKWLSNGSSEEKNDEKSLQKMFKISEMKVAKVQSSYFQQRKLNQYTGLPTVAVAKFGSEFTDLPYEKLAG